MKYLTLTAIPDDSIAAAWNDCLNNSDFAGLYTAPEYFGVEYFKDRVFAILAISDSLVHGLVTGFRSDRDITCGNRGSPQICIRRGTNADAVGRALAAGLKSQCLPSTKFIGAFAWRDLPGLQSAGFRLRTYESPLGTILLDPSRGADNLFRQCSPARRYNIRYAIKNGVEVEEMNLARDFDDYYSLYSHWCEAKRYRRQPYEVQRAVFESRDNRLLLVARHDGRLIGVSTFRYRRPGIMEYTANVSRRGERRLKQNDLLLWRGIEWSTQQPDIRYFSMAGAHTFLERFGGQRHATFRYSLDLTAFRWRHLVEAAQAGAVTVYHVLPKGARWRIKRLLHRDRELH